MLTNAVRKTKLSSFSQSFLQRDNEGEGDEVGSILHPLLPSYHQQPVTTGYTANSTFNQSPNDQHTERLNSGLYGEQMKMEKVRLQQNVEKAHLTITKSLGKIQHLEARDNSTEKNF